MGIRSITEEGREQGKRFGVEQFEMVSFSRDRHLLKNLVVTIQKGVVASRATATERSGGGVKESDSDKGTGFC